MSWSVYSADETGTKPIQITRSQLCYIHFVFLGSIIMCQLYKLTFQTKPKSLCNWQLCRFRVNIFSPCWRTWFFLAGPKPALGGHVSVSKDGDICSIACTGKDFSLSHHVQTGPRTHPAQPLWAQRGPTTRGCNGTNVVMVIHLSGVSKLRTHPSYSLIASDAYVFLYTAHKWSLDSFSPWKTQKRWKEFSI